MLTTVSNYWGEYAAEAEANQIRWEKHRQASPTGCQSQCDGCHTIENCTPGTHRVGDLLLCAACASARRRVLRLAHALADGPL